MTAEPRYGTAEPRYGAGARTAPSGRFACDGGGMVSSPTEGPWVHFEDWLENELALEKLAETAGSAVYRPLGMEVETEGVFFTAKELLRGVCVGAAAITFLLLIALLLRLVIEVWS